MVFRHAIHNFCVLHWALQNCTPRTHRLHSLMLKYKI